jgi:asparagine synthase (glutamine-hydrolysing)
MGAILGRVALDGRPVDERVFGRAFDGLRPGRCVRSDMVVDGPAGYGHHDMGMTATVPQPLREGPLTLLADARLYDRNDLAHALGVTAQDHSDAALILQAYMRWGADCLTKMNGDYGFAIHDRSTGEVFLARDHIGAQNSGRERGAVCNFSARADRAR